MFGLASPHKGWGEIERGVGCLPIRNSTPPAPINRSTLPDLRGGNSRNQSGLPRLLGKGNQTHFLINSVSIASDSFLKLEITRRA